jgi:hypothetical protein
LRAAALPTETNFSSACRSSGVKVTRYFSMAGFLSLGQSALRQPYGTESCITRQSKIETALGTRTTIERVESGNSQPKAARASALPDGHG